MGLEAGNYIDNLVATNPLGTDAKSLGDDHLRLIKTALKNCFAGFTGAVVVTGTDGGAVNAYTLTTTPALIGYTTRMIAVFSPTIANTGAATINISGLGTRPLVSVSNAALVAGDLTPGTIYSAAYDGTSFRLLSITKNYADQLAFSAALPNQAGNAGKFLTTNGTVASWTDTFTIPITFQSRVDEAKGADIASAATINLSTATGNLIHITGNTGPITAITIPVGAERTLIFDSNPVLTNSASLLLPFTGNIQVAAGDRVKVRGDTAGAVVVGYQRADGTPLKLGGLVWLATLTPTAAANVDALNVFTSAYDNSLIMGQGVTVGTSDALRVQFAVAGVVDTANNYVSGVGDGAAATAAVASISLSTSGNVFGGGRGINFSLTVSNINDASTRIKSAQVESIFQTNATPGFIRSTAGGVYTAASALSGVRFFWNGGNNFAATGVIRIYGYNNT